MDIIKKYLKTHHLQKQNYVTVWKKRLLNEKNCFILRQSKLLDEKYTPTLYKGICKTAFKTHYTNHKKKFNTEKNKNDTKLSTEYWKLAHGKISPTGILEYKR